MFNIWINVNVICETRRPNLICKKKIWGKDIQFVLIFGWMIRVSQFLACTEIWFGVCQSLINIKSRCHNTSGQNFCDRRYCVWVVAVVAGEYPSSVWGRIVTSDVSDHWSAAACSVLRQSDEFKRWRIWSVSFTYFLSKMLRVDVIVRCASLVSFSIYRQHPRFRCLSSKELSWRPDVVKPGFH